MSDKKKPPLTIPRRSMLAGLGGLMFGLPFLETLGCSRRPFTSPGLEPERTGRIINALDVMPKRLVVLFTRNGSDFRTHFPTGSETSFTLSPILSPLEPLKQNAIFTKGIDNRAATYSHGDAHVAALTGRACLATSTDYAASAGISIDQFVANRIGTTTKYKTLDVKINTDVEEIISYYGAYQPVLAEDNAVRLFNTVFAGVTEMTSGPDPTLVALRANRKSVLDAVLPHFASLRAKVSATDKLRIDRHLDNVRNLETQVANGPALSAGCSVPMMPVPNGTNTSLELIAHALQCDLTRVATVNIGTGGYEAGLGIPGAYHNDWVHNLLTAPDAGKWIQVAKTWETQQVANFCALLKSMPEGAGTVFDNTLVVWLDEFMHGYAHANNDIPYVFLSGSNQFFRMGRYLDYGPGGASNNEVWLAVRDALGVTGAFGDPQYGSTPLGRLT